jgi:hypothetical protein
MMLFARVGALASVQLLQKLEKNTIREKIEFEVVRVVA